MLNASNMGQENMAALREALGVDRMLKLQSQMGMTTVLTLNVEELRRIMDRVAAGPTGGPGSVVWGGEE